MRGWRAFASASVGLGVVAALGACQAQFVSPEKPDLYKVPHEFDIDLALQGPQDDLSAALDLGLEKDDLSATVDLTLPMQDLAKKDANQ